MSPRDPSQVRVGDVLSAVNGRSVLLESYDDMCASLKRAQRLPYTLTFRRAPFHRGWLWKRSRRQSDSKLSGLTGWKKRYFCLCYGYLFYYDDHPNKGGKQKGYFSLATRDEPPVIVASGDNAIVLRHRADRLVLKSATTPSDIHNWAALLHIAIAHVNGGNDLLRTEERRRLEAELTRARRPTTPQKPGRPTTPQKPGRPTTPSRSSIDESDMLLRESMRQVLEANQQNPQDDDDFEQPPALVL